MPRSFVPTDEQRRRVKMLASLGQRQEQIALVVGIGSTTTLRKHFREELTRGPAEAMANVRKTLFQMATSGKHPAATMFWLKTRARWSETAHLAHGTPAVPTLMIGREVDNESACAD